jgi:hypothetical protein
MHRASLIGQSVLPYSQGRRLDNGSAHTVQFELLGARTTLITWMQKYRTVQ